jgi:hypothetical protein
MSLELYILSPRRLRSIQEWQGAVDKYSFPLRFQPDTDFDKTSGFLPLRLRDRRSGFECDHWSIDDIRDTCGVPIDPRFKHVLAFRWGGNCDELISVTQASAAYSVATDGLIFDCQEGDFVSNEKSIEAAKTIEEQVKPWR